MKNLFHKLLLLALVSVSAGIAVPPVCMDLAPLSPPVDANNTCGNGVVDDGELCDDGNVVGGDGCNAWCNAFDRLSSACTMAGSMQTCSKNTPQLGLPAQSVFCDLTCMTARDYNGVTSLFLADGGVLMQYDIMVSPTARIQAFAKTPVGASPYKRFCSITALANSDVVVAHECNQRKVILFSSPRQAAGVRVIADLADILAPVPSDQVIRDYFDPATNQLLIAGLPSPQNAADVPPGKLSKVPDPPTHVYADCVFDTQVRAPSCMLCSCMSHSMARLRHTYRARLTRLMISRSTECVRC